MAITLADVAAAAGVSHNTVSCALRGTGRMSDETRQRVIKVAQQMGYRPNGNARAIRTGRCGAIALLQDASGIRSNLEMHLILGLVRATGSRNLSLQIACFSDEEIGLGRPMPKLFTEQVADGLLLNYHSVLPEGLEEQIAGLPHVFINRKQERNSVYPDEYNMARELAEHMLKEGYENLYFLDRYYFNHASPETHYSQLDRLAGYKAAVGKAKLPVESLLGNTDQSLEPNDLLAFVSSRNAGKKIGIIADSPLICQALISLAPAFGLENGKNFAVAYFANQRSELPCYIMVQDWRQVAENAVNMLEQRIRNPKEDRDSIAIPGKLGKGFAWN